MKKVPYHNDTDRFVHVGPVTIAPHSIREVDPSHLDPKKPAEMPAPEDPEVIAQRERAEALADILGLGINHIEKILPTLSDVDLDDLEAAEKSAGDKARNGVLQLILSAKLARAKGESDPEKKARELAAILARNLKDIEPILPTLSDEDLSALEEMEKAAGDKSRKGVMDLIAKTKVNRLQA